MPEIRKSTTKLKHCSSYDKRMKSPTIIYALYGTVWVLSVLSGIMNLQYNEMTCIMQHISDLKVDNILSPVVQVSSTSDT